MKIAVIGAGGVGGTFGAALAKAGADVWFLARGAHLDAMRTHGLRIVSPRGDTHLVPTQASDDPAAIGPADVVLFCVKLWDVESAGERIRPMVGPGTAVIPLQNGIDASDRLIPILGAGAVHGRRGPGECDDRGTGRGAADRNVHAAGVWRIQRRTQRARRGVSGAVPEGGLRR